MTSAAVVLQHVGRWSAETRFAFALVISCVAATVVSRPLEVYAGLPSKLNYAHFALAVAATLLLMSPKNTPVNTRTRVLLGVFLGVSIFSWLWNGEGSLVAVALSWMVLAEPLMIAAAVAELVARGYAGRVFRFAALLLVVVQLPFAAYQLAAFGMGDPVQGLLIHQGAGSHVLGFMAMTVAIWTFSRILYGSARDNVTRQLAILAVCFMLGVVTDTKQGFVVFIIVSVALVMAPSVGEARTRLARRILLVVVMAALVTAAIELNASTSQVGDSGRRSNFVDAKVDALAAFASQMRGESGGLLFGLGPGRSASRIAWLAMNDMTLQQFGVAPSDTTARLSGVWRDASNDQSSAASPFFSWLGVVGDVGLLGLGVYLAAWLMLWRFAAQGGDGRSARAVIAFVFLLGFLFNWMEEPALMALVALLVGASGAPRRSTVPPLHPVGWATKLSPELAHSEVVGPNIRHTNTGRIPGGGEVSVRSSLTELGTLPNGRLDGRGPRCDQLSVTRRSDDGGR